MALALQREQTAYRSLLMVSGAVLADPEPMLSRLVRGCITLHCLRTHRTLEPWCIQYDLTQISVSLMLQELKLRAAHIYCLQQCAIPILYSYRKHCMVFGYI